MGLRLLTTDPKIGRLFWINRAGVTREQGGGSARGAALHLASPASRWRRVEELPSVTEEKEFLRREVSYSGTGIVKY